MRLAAHLRFRVFFEHFSRSYAFCLIDNFAFPRFKAKVSLTPVLSFSERGFVRFPKRKDIPLKVVILCGGQGTRLREETEYRPKPMVEIGGRPILWHIMKLYAHHGHRDFVLCLGYRGNMIKEYFLNYEAMTTDFTVCLGRLAPGRLPRRPQRAGLLASPWPTPA